MSGIRTKWAAVGAAIAVTLGAGGVGISQAKTSTGERPIYQPIEPCRLAALRTGADQVGPRSAPLGPTDTLTLSGWGAVGACDLPVGTTALALNVTAIGATQQTFLTVYPGRDNRPFASHLNPAPGQPPTPNAVNVDLDDVGEFSVYNDAGNVRLIIDVVGLYDDHDHDDRYPQKSEVYTKSETDAAVNKAGSTIRGVFAVQYTAAAGGDTGVDSISFGTELETAPEEHVIQGGGLVPAGCSGTASEPGAEAGHLCLFITSDTKVDFRCVASVEPAYLCNGAGRFGATYFLTSSGAGNVTSVGVWALGVPAGAGS